MARFSSKYSTKKQYQVQYRSISITESVTKFNCAVARSITLPEGLSQKRASAINETQLLLPGARVTDGKNAGEPRGVDDKMAVAPLPGARATIAPAASSAVRNSAAPSAGKGSSIPACEQQSKTSSVSTQVSLVRLHANSSAKVALLWAEVFHTQHIKTRGK